MPSRWFVDSKQTACRPDGIIAIADAALEVIPDDATAIGGLTMGADPVAFGDRRGRRHPWARALRSFSIRKEAKDHGVTGRLAGALERRGQGGDHRGHGHPGHLAVGGRRRWFANSAPNRWLIALAVVDRGGTCEAMAAAEAGIPFRRPRDRDAPDLGIRVRRLTALRVASGR